ncbi:hypothetical protein [Parasegetibacter sp. NRK P23]|uniref:hypothetical protein n=1 Tax=Parasegetibacter sp. NRK P23 TaxID=2942999 RepID=UPI00204469D3|nr:hypothetical protein [Parasegetibacter sp. NRK P23]MCM5528978.1 hypothetical protein [Parasegetibacter sp. NRK P23]
MALEDTITELRNFVNANVVQNGTRNISGQQMNIILNSILNIILTLPGGGSSGYEFKAGYMFDINSEGITVTGDNVQSDDWIGWDIVLFFIGYGPLNNGPGLTDDLIASFSYEKETGIITFPPESPILGQFKFENQPFYIQFNPKMITTMIPPL